MAARRISIFFMGFKIIEFNFVWAVLQGSPETILNVRFHPIANSAGRTLLFDYPTLKFLFQAPTRSFVIRFDSKSTIYGIWSLFTWFIHARSENISVQATGTTKIKKSAGSKTG